ncbi:methylated-DNA--[protein]-cysteine S-methyltransferase [Streptomyces sp. NPDC049954]|uniref:methylated-DNA--[protein]-cysteine S-methyltransferase n=1 Tax=Streptomyces sp. NPDC049954 TaxID=3155779 RepID=UPI003435BEB7
MKDIAGSDARDEHRVAEAAADTSPAGRAEVDRLIAGLATHEAPALGRLHARLAERAEEAGLLDIAYRTLDTPAGSLLLAATGEGLIRVAFAVQDHAAVLQDLADTVSPRVLRAPARLDATARQLDEYFAGTRRRFELPLDRRLSKGFRRTVLDRLGDIGYGRTESYAQVAAAAGSPRAVRAVGTACATNPLPLVVPCHRVVRSDGTSGGYAGGPEAKRLLLTMERAA